ncbi:K(+)-transporting ATPase subunit F [Leekyejoonella antrihumi]|nr:K(+)-transporting ATPase subunit F [Leekyejoonella antrihumi]
MTCAGRMTEYLVAAIIAVALVGYLIYALVRPDKF